MVEKNKEIELIPRETITSYKLIIYTYSLGALLLISSFFFPSSPGFSSFLGIFTFFTILVVLLSKYEKDILILPPFEKKSPSLSQQKNRDYSKIEKKAFSFYLIIAIIGVILYEMNYVDIDTYLHSTIFLVLLLSFSTILISRLFKEESSFLDKIHKNTIVFTYSFLKFYLWGWVMLLFILAIAEGD